MTNFNVTEGQLEIANRLGLSGYQLLFDVLRAQKSGKEFSERGSSKKYGVGYKIIRNFVKNVQKFTFESKQDQETKGALGAHSGRTSFSTGAVSWPLEGALGAHSGRIEQKKEQFDQENDQIAQIEDATFLKPSIPLPLNENSYKDELSQRENNQLLFGVGGDGIIQNLVKQNKQNIEKIFTYYLKTFERERRIGDDANLEAIEKVLNAGYTERQLCEAIKGYSINDYFMNYNASPSIKNIFEKGGQISSERIDNHLSTYATYQRKNPKTSNAEGNKGAEKNYACSYHSADECGKSKAQCPKNITERDVFMMNGQPFCWWHRDVVIAHNNPSSIEAMKVKMIIG